KPKTENKTKDDSKARTHIVAANETLYRIAMNYYGSDAGIEKIKKANGLSSNDIMAGQKLIIP
ncbi:MAG TPA: LysM peptidoglycan-binding domain-containing protein, partial [Sporosarcina sp.]|nr:LysM peptidoglycan-binding domain-containing protein [Sporosarcina sp.]